MDLGVKNGVNRNVDPTFLFDFVRKHYRPILHPLATTHNAADGRAIGKGRLCYSIGGLKRVRIETSFPLENFTLNLAPFTQ